MALPRADIKGLRPYICHIDLEPILYILLTATGSDANFPCALFMALPKLHTRVIIHDNE